MAVSDEQIEEIRAKVDIADLVSSYGFHLKQVGGILWCCCPFHTEKTPSFKVDSSRGTYHCFGCGESGDVFSFVQKQEGLSFMEAVRKLAEKVGVELRAAESKSSRTRRRLYELMSALAADFNKMLRSPKNIDGEPAREYLRTRHLDSEIVGKFLIGYAPKDVDKILAWAGRHGYSYQDLADAGVIKLPSLPTSKPYFYFANRLVFAIKDKNGQVVAFSGRQLVEDKKSGKYVNSPETLIFKKSRTFFAFDEARKHIVKDIAREAIICEGQIDCIRLHANGYNTAVAPLGTAFTEDHAILLHRVADNALLCFDDDEAGHKATIKTARILLSEGIPIRVVSLPDGDDPDSYILRHGAKAFGMLVKDRAESIVKFQIRVEAAKESDPSDSNATARIAKAVLETIAKSKDKVLRDALLKETAKRLGIEYAALAESILKKVATPQKDSNPIDSVPIGQIPSSSNAEGETTNLVEGELVKFLFSNERVKDLREDITKLIPLQILQLPLMRKLVAVWIKGKTKETDAVRDTIEGLPIEEYRTFISLMTHLEPMWFSNISIKNQLVYFARQIWHNFLVRQLNNHRNNPTNEKFLGSAIKTLHSATIQGVVHLIVTFPLNRFVGEKTQCQNIK